MMICRRCSKFLMQRAAAQATERQAALMSSPRGLGMLTCRVLKMLQITQCHSQKLTRSTN
jgi:hypothetical protein